ncbi:cytochrome c-type biogenesis protein CcmH [Candidatus Pelagibacter bacterium]|nr:cytochrome c-type biogenesis protein CcmH [Candidatus Pelagibacter bacterium]
MRILKTFLLVVLFINIANANTDIKDENLNNKILKNIRCLVCQGQSVYDSESEFSSTIKLLVKKKINEGKSEKQIYEFLRKRYGDWVIFEPKLNKNTYILWILPLLLFLLGGAIIRKKFK